MSTSLSIDPVTGWAIVPSSGTYTLAITQALTSVSVSLPPMPVDGDSVTITSPREVVVLLTNQPTPRTVANDARIPALSAGVPRSWQYSETALSWQITS